MLVCSNDSQANYEKKDPNIEEEESSNDDVKPKQSRKKSSIKKAALKQEQVEDDDDHGRTSLKIIYHITVGSHYLRFTYLKLLSFIHSFKFISLGLSIFLQSLIAKKSVILNSVFSISVISQTVCSQL